MGNELNEASIEKHVNFFYALFGIIQTPAISNLVCQVVDFESVESWNELVGGSLRPVLRMDHEEHVRKPGAEVRAVGVVVSRRLRRVHVHALRAVQLHHRFWKNRSRINLVEPGLAPAIKHSR